MTNNQEGAGDVDFTLKSEIIDEVQQRLILYNKGHPMYFHCNAKNDEFVTIGLVLGIPREYNVINAKLFWSTADYCNTIFVWSKCLWLTLAAAICNLAAKIFRKITFCSSVKLSNAM